MKIEDICNKSLFSHKIRIVFINMIDYNGWQGVLMTGVPHAKEGRKMEKKT